MNCLVPDNIENATMLNHGRGRRITVIFVIFYFLLLPPSCFLSMYLVKDKDGGSFYQSVSAVTYNLSYPTVLIHRLTIRQVDQERALKYFNRVKDVGGIEQRVYFFTYTPLMTVSNYSFGDGVWIKSGFWWDISRMFVPSTKRPAIVLNSKMINTLSDLALLGVIAHEFGHIALEHNSSQTYQQDEADRWAATVVGRDAVVAYIQAFDRKDRKIMNTPDF